MFIVAFNSATKGYSRWGLYIRGVVPTCFLNYMYTYFNFFFLTGIGAETVLLEKDFWDEQPNEAAQKCFSSAWPRCCGQREGGSSEHPGPRTLKATAGQSGGCRLLREGFPVPSAAAQGEEEAPTSPALQLASPPSTPCNFCLIATFFPHPKPANRAALIFFFLLAIF